MPDHDTAHSAITSRRLVAGIVLLAATLAFEITTAVAQAPPDPREVMARSLEAAGGDTWRGVETLKITARLEASKLAGRQETLEDLFGGKSAVSWTLGDTTGGSGFDGERPWFRDDSGDVTVLDSQGELEAARAEAFRTARAWWFPHRWPAQLTSICRETLDGRTFDVVTVFPEGARSFEIWIDAETNRIGRLVEQGSNRVTTTEFFDYRKVDGLWLPFRIVSSSGEENSEITTLVDSVEINPQLSEDAFSVPVAQLSDFEMPAGARSVTLPFELLNNHIYVMASVNDSAPRRFLVDTGGLNILTAAAAAELGVATVGSFPISGAGEDTVQGSYARLDRFTLGGIVFPAPQFLVIPFEEIVRAEGVEMAGLVGFEVFRRFVVTVDYGARILTLIPPEAFVGRPGAVTVPFTFDGRHPVVKGSIDTIPGTFTIDTGSRSTVDLHAPFVADHDLMATYRPSVEALTGWGVGGSVRSHIARAKKLRLGDVEISDVIVELTGQERGAFADRYQAGNIGGGVLKRFSVTFDYQHQEILFETNPLYRHRDVFDQSGMWLNDFGSEFLVEDVVAGGSADDAGIVVGDRITAVDGVPVADLSLPELRRRFRTEPSGTSVKFALVRNGAERSLEIRLEDLLPLEDRAHPSVHSTPRPGD